MAGVQRSGIDRCVMRVFTKGKKMAHYKFWMVFAEGGQSPNKQHFSEFDAREEAKRLAKKNGRPAYVLESVTGYEVPEPAVSEFHTDEYVPQPHNASLRGASPLAGEASPRSDS